MIVNSVIIIGNSNEFLFDFALFPNPVQRVFNNFTFPFYFDEENLIRLEYVILPDNEIAGWTQNYKLPIIVIFINIYTYSDTP